MRPRLLAPLALLALATGCASLVTGGKLVSDPNGPTGQIVIQNRSRVAVNVVLLSRCSASSYGLNRLAKGASVAPGASAQFTVSPDCWDVAVGRVGYGEARRRFATVPANGRVTYAVTD